MMFVGLRNWSVGYLGVKVKPLSLSDEAKNNVVLAKETVAYVEGYMTVGASNKIGDVVQSVGMSMVCVLSMRAETGESAGSDLLATFREWAEAAKTSGCGNCGEQAAIAFIRLYDLGIRPLDYMQVTNGDHAFVLIGRRDGDAHAVSKWGPHAVVCDPWKEEAYPADGIGKELGRKATFGSIYRIT